MGINGNISWLVITTITTLACLPTLISCHSRNYYATRRSLKVVTGDQVELECDTAENAAANSAEQLDGGSLLRLQWTKDGATVASYNQATQSAEWWVASARHVLDRVTFRLSIYNTQREDSGIYRCRPHFRNSYTTWISPHSIEDATELVVIGPPTPPGRAIVSAHTSRTVTLNWEPSQSHADVPVIQYIIVVNVGKDGKKEVYKEVYSTGNRTTKVIPSLSPYTVYTFYVIAENLAGKSAPGDISYPIRTKGEAPVGPPKVRYAYNATNTSVVLTWDHPPSHTLHGPLVGYRIIARPQSSAGQRREFYVNKPDINSYELTGLAVYAPYVVSLEADNSYGYSPPDTVSFLTEEGMPTSSPTVLRASGRTSHSIELTWTAPNNSNGIVNAYTIYYWSESKSWHLEQPEVSVARIPVNNNNGGRVRINGARDIMLHMLENLQAHTKYFLSMSASTRKGEGPRSQQLTVITDTAAPGPPRLTTIFALAPNTIYLGWQQPNTHNGPFDLYMISIKADGQQQQVALNTTETAVNVTSLKHMKRYFVSVRAITYSTVMHGKTYNGDASPEEVFLITEESSKPFTRTTLCPSKQQQNEHITKAAAANGKVPYCDEALRTVTSPQEKAAKSTTGIAVAICITMLLVLVLATIFGLFMYRRYRKTAPFLLKQTSKGGNVYVATPFASDSCQVVKDEPQLQKQFTVAEFLEHVRKMHMDDNLGFAKEYEQIDNMSVTAEQYTKLTCEHSLLPENKAKNRYVNILAYDHSRVLLRTIPEKPASDYINANYVDGFNQPKAYIATQGPLPNTYSDFWRMIWEQKCLVIVMITNVVERGKKKCDQYWPSEGCETYDWFQIKVFSESNTAYYTVRTMSVKNLKLKTQAERVIFHYHYKDWPDHGVPDQTLPVLSFIRKSSAANRDSAGPIVVHCSAGVGRSGTYIVIDSMLKQIKLNATLSVSACLKHIRTQRNFLVQTEDQYIFCNDALAEAIQYGGETEISAVELPKFVEKLSEKASNDKMTTPLKKQFEILDIKTTQIQNTAEARRLCNTEKNRSQEVIPVDAYRVLLSPRPGTEGSDYINATFLQGYYRQDEFIVTQFPLEKTKPDFWQMIWDWQCRTIVLLWSEDSEAFDSFWPELYQSLHYWQFSVHQMRCETGPNWAVRDLVMQANNQDGYQLCCRMVSCPGWPNSCSPDEIFELLDAVQDWHYQFHDKSPIVVVDRHGSTEAATFCALTTISCQLEQDSSVDIFQIVKLYCTKRQGVFDSLDNYQFLYTAAKELCCYEKRNEELCTVWPQSMQHRRKLRNDKSRLSLCNAAAAKIQDTATLGEFTSSLQRSSLSSSISTSEMPFRAVSSAFPNETITQQIMEQQILQQTEPERQRSSMNTTTFLRQHSPFSFIDDYSEREQLQQQNCNTNCTTNASYDYSSLSTTATTNSASSESGYSIREVLLIPTGNRDGSEENTHLSKNDVISRTAIADTDAADVSNVSMSTDDDVFASTNTPSLSTELLQLQNTTIDMCILDGPIPALFRKTALS